MKRSVQFWRIVARDGTDLMDVFPAHEVIKSLVDAEALGLNRYRSCRDGMVLIGHGKTSKERSMMVLDKVRRENLPSVGDSKGTRRPIGLAPEEGLLEPTYCCFAENNVVAMLVSGNGPRPQRLADYLRAKFAVDVGLAPVLTQNLDEVLREMRVTAVDVAIPAANINRSLVGGDWVQALDAGRQLSTEGVIRVGFSVGRRGSRSDKRRIGERFRELVNQLRGSGGLGEFQSAKVAGTIDGMSKTVDLLNDRFVQQTEVNADLLGNPERSVGYARRLLSAAIRENADYLAEVNPSVTGPPLAFSGRIIESPDDERE